MPNPQTFGSNSFKDDRIILLFVGELTLSINRAILPLLNFTLDACLRYRSLKTS